MLACWECRNQQSFFQISDRGDARDLEQQSTGLKPKPWDRPDERPPGVYCARCQRSVEGDVGELGLADDRIDFLHPDDVDAEKLAAELQALRPDAEWTRLELPPRSARFADCPLQLHPALLDALDRTGRSQLFTHQADAISSALVGDNVVQATAAGSGKSFGLTLPVLDRLLRDPAATAILAYPLKALANDQMAALQRFGLDAEPWVNASSFDLRLGDGIEPIRVARYDGSTMEHERAEVRRHARIIVTNPDMIHASVLRKASSRYADGSSWSRLFSGLSFIVLDELHSYQGVFGSNVANVLRRLRRVAADHGAGPQFLTASATIGNPVELARRLTSVDQFTLVDDDGSARARRIVLVCNPPARSADPAAAKAVSAKKGDPVDESGRVAPQTVAIELMSHGALASDQHLPVRTIAFCRSRNAVFQLSERTRKALKEARRTDLADAVAPYAATFLADDRVEAEGKLRDGSTMAIVSTSALELGIDIPDLSLAVLVGYPGQISSFRQRIGRAGRRGEGVAVLIVGDDPLQQWLARDPDALRDLLDAPAESVVVNPDAGPIVQRFGLAPAQAELGGIAFEDAAWFGDAVETWLADATGPPSAQRRGNPYWTMPWPEDDPHGTSLRDAMGERGYTVMNQSGRTFEPIGVLDAMSAPRDAFVPAIWTAAGGLLYRVTGFDMTKREIYCQGPVESPFQTRGVPVDQVTITSDHVEPRAHHGAVIGYGALALTRQVFSYKEQHFSGVERNEKVQRGWPALEFSTDGLYLHLDLAALGGLDRDASAQALEHVLLSVAPALVACDPYDLDSSNAGPTVYLYDSFGGGLRLSEVLFDRFGELVELAHSVVTSCPCADGCPGCVMLSRRPDGNDDLSKAGAVALLESLR